VVTLSPKRDNDAMLVNFTEVSRKITSGVSVQFESTALRGGGDQEEEESGENSEEEGSGFDDSHHQMVSFQHNGHPLDSLAQRVNSWDAPPLSSAPVAPRREMLRTSSTGTVPPNPRHSVRVIKVESESSKLTAATLSLNRIE
jgi:hypothetical protein